MILWKKIFFSFSHWSCFRNVHFGADTGTAISTLPACPIQYHDINTVSSDPTSQMLSPSKSIVDLKGPQALRECPSAGSKAQQCRALGHTHSFDIHLSCFLCESVSHSVLSNFCNRMDCSPPGSSVHRVLRARILEWVAIPFSRASSQSRDQTCVSTWF